MTEFICTAEKGVTHCSGGTFPFPDETNCIRGGRRCDFLKEVPKLIPKLRFPEGHDGLRTTIQYALPYMGDGTYYEQAVFIADRVREWQNDTSKIPGTIYRRKKPAEPEKRYECSIGNKRYSNRPPRGCHIRFPSWKNCTDDGLPCHNLKEVSGERIQSKIKKAFLEAMKEKFAVEPELVICPNHTPKCDPGQCDHKYPHKFDIEKCRGKPHVGCQSNTHCLRSRKCVPYHPKTTEEIKHVVGEDKPHESRCETCVRNTCYFYPLKSEWRNGMTPQKAISINNPISIQEFINRFGCASYKPEHGTVLDQLAELYEQLGNLYHLRGDRQKSAIFYGVMVLLKQQKFTPEEIHEELQATLKEIAKMRE
jgi:hypothetical protein